MTFLKLFVMSPQPYGGTPGSGSRKASSTSGSPSTQNIAAFYSQPQPPPYSFNPAGHAPYAPTYSHVSVARLAPTSRLVSLAGQVGHDAATATTPPDFPTQVRVALDNVGRCLAAAGARKADVVSVRQYVVGLGRMPRPEREERARLYLEWMEGNAPPSTLLGVEALADESLLYEIEVTAVVDAESADVAAAAAAW